MPRDDLYLVEMIEACRHIRVFLADITPEAWVESELVRSAVLQKLIVLGEAAGAISSDCRERYPDIPWATVRAFATSPCTNISLWNGPGCRPLPLATCPS